MSGPPPTLAPTAPLVEQLSVNQVPETLTAAECDRQESGKSVAPLIGNVP
jgi:hypothetical protein